MKQILRLKNDRTIEFTRMEMMGIVNVTPDSFYAGSRRPSAQAAFAKAGQHLADGALIVDIGGESTRPGSSPVTAEEEADRICPVIERVRQAFPRAVISADTYRASTAKAALEAGADMINDISGLTFEPDLAEVIAEAGAAVVLTHTGGRPENMQDDPRYEDVVEEVFAFLREQIGFAVSRGIGRDQIMVDVGIGFGKDRDHNLDLLRNIGRFNTLGCPQLLAVSRKTFIGATLGRDDPDQRLSGTLAVTAFAAERGLAAARVHDVRENLDAARMAEELSGK